jgi:hypothetical protein
MSPSLKEYFRYVLTSVVVTAVVMVLGALPTLRWSNGSTAQILTAAAVGCLVGLGACALGGWPIAHAGSAPEAKLKAATMSIAARFGGVLVLGLLAVLSGRFVRGTLLAWIGLSYVVGLAVEIRYAARAFKVSPQGASK